MGQPVRLVHRQEIGLDPVVRNANGTPRPRMHLPAIYVIHHWPGVNVYYGDVGDSVKEILSIEEYSKSVGKPNQYNYVNHQDPDNLVFEYTGPYRAAHSAGENAIGIGVLHLNGTHELLNLHQVLKMQWLNDIFRLFGLRGPNTIEIPHSLAPGASTGCPGDDIRHKIRHFNRPSQPEVPDPSPPPAPKPPAPKPPVPVDPPDSRHVGYYLVTDGKSPWSISSEIYGTGTRWPEIMEANAPDDTPNPGERWVAPGFDGIWTEVKAGEGPWQILNRLFGSNGWNKSTGVEQFWQWNGGDPEFGGRMFNGKRIALQPGERVWVRN